MEEEEEDNESEEDDDMDQDEDALLGAGGDSNDGSRDDGFQHV